MNVSVSKSVSLKQLHFYTKEWHLFFIYLVLPKASAQKIGRGWKEHLWHFSWPLIPRDLGFFSFSPCSPWAGLHWSGGQLQVPVWRTKREEKKARGTHTQKNLNCNCQILHHQMPVRPAVDKVLKTQTKMTWYGLRLWFPDHLTTHSRNSNKILSCTTLPDYFPSHKVPDAFFRRNKTKQMSVITGSYCSSSEWQCNTQTVHFL